MSGERSSCDLAPLADVAHQHDFSALGRQFKGYFLQVNARNLFDKTYVALCQDAGCYYGLRRQVIATLRYRWKSTLEDKRAALICLGGQISKSLSSPTSKNILLPF